MDIIWYFPNKPFLLSRTGCAFSLFWQLAIFQLPDQGSTPDPWQWEFRVLTTRLPGNFQNLVPLQGYILGQSPGFRFKNPFLHRWPHPWALSSFPVDDLMPPHRSPMATGLGLWLLLGNEMQEGMTSPHFFLFCVNQQYSKINLGPREKWREAEPHPTHSRHATEVRNISYVNSLWFVGELFTTV